MKSRLIFLTISMVAAIALFACAPAVIAPSKVSIDASVSATAAPADSSAPEAVSSAPAQLVEVQPVATSRGPNLEATDPTTVSLATGQLQLVEFFRFT